MWLTLAWRRRLVPTLRPTLLGWRALGTSALLGLHVRSVSHVLSESAYATGNLKASVGTRSYEQSTYILVLATQRNDRDPAEREPFPAPDGVGRPVSAIVTLRCGTLVAFKLAREVYRPSA